MYTSVYKHCNKQAIYSGNHSGLSRSEYAAEHTGNYYDRDEQRKGSILEGFPYLPCRGTVLSVFD